MGPRATVTTKGKTSRNQFVLLGGVSVVAIAVVIRLLASGPKAADASTDAGDTSATAPEAAIVTPSPAAATPINVSWPTDVARDPFNSDLVFPAAPPPKPKSQLAPVPTAPATVDLGALAKDTIHLKATVLGDRPFAMINGRLFRAGEVVEGFKILDIGNNRITIERDGSRLLLAASKD